MRSLIGYYAATHYRIMDGDEELYRAGNSPHCSQTYVDANKGVGLETMREWCEQTGRDMAQSEGYAFAGVEQEEDMSDG